MKSFTDLFIKRPVLALVVSFVILIAGLQAIRTINVRQYPRIDIASIKITTVYVGADAELVRGFITTPLERAIAAADGIDYIQSQSSQSTSTITVRLKLNYDPNKAFSDISSKVDAIPSNFGWCNASRIRFAIVSGSHDGLPNVGICALGGLGRQGSPQIARLVVAVGSTEQERKRDSGRREAQW